MKKFKHIMAVAMISVCSVSFGQTEESLVREKIYLAEKELRKVHSSVGNPERPDEYKYKENLKALDNKINYDIRRRDETLAEIKSRYEGTLAQINRSTNEQYKKEEPIRAKEVFDRETARIENLYSDSINKFETEKQKMAERYNKVVEDYNQFLVIYRKKEAELKSLEEQLVVARKNDQAKVETQRKEKHDRWLEEVAQMKEKDRLESEQKDLQDRAASFSIEGIDFIQQRGITITSRNGKQLSRHSPGLDKEDFYKSFKTNKATFFVFRTNEPGKYRLVMVDDKREYGSSFSFNESSGSITVVGDKFISSNNGITEVLAIGSNNSSLYVAAKGPTESMNVNSKGYFIPDTGGFKELLSSPVGNVYKGKDGFIYIHKNNALHRLPNITKLDNYQVVQTHYGSFLLMYGQSSNHCQSESNKMFGISVGKKQTCSDVVLVYSISNHNDGFFYHGTFVIPLKDYYEVNTMHDNSYKTVGISINGIKSNSSRIELSAYTMPADWANSSFYTQGGIRWIEK